MQLPLLKPRDAEALLGLTARINDVKKCLVTVQNPASTYYYPKPYVEEIVSFRAASEWSISAREAIVEYALTAPAKKLAMCLKDDFILGVKHLAHNNRLDVDGVAQIFGVTYQTAKDWFLTGKLSHSHGWVTVTEFLKICSFSGPA